MGTVSKALGLLEFLRKSESPLRLSDLARRAGYDKATARRLLLELAANGFVEIDASTKAYILGPALQMLGRAREHRVPLYRAVQPTVRQLAEVTGETVHAAEYFNGVLGSICVEESQRGNRVILEIGQKLPLHATASGYAFLAASAPAFVEGIVAKPLARFTATTPITRQMLVETIEATRARGYSLSNQSLEEGVSSVAAPIRDAGGKPIGTLAIAMPSSRATVEVTCEFGALVRKHADEVSLRLFGQTRPAGGQRGGRP